MIRVTGDIDKLLDLDRQIRFAAATALTAAAKEAQSASIKAVENTFTTRSQWYRPGNKFGVRVTPASKDSLTASVHTDAHWLELHETGGVKTPRGRHIAVPTRNVRRSPRQVIPRSQRPHNLRRAFVVQTASGPALFERRSRRVVALYHLEPRARITRRSTVVEPTEKVVERRMQPIFDRALERALETAG